MLTILSADDTDMAGHLRGAANFEKLASNCHIRIGIKLNLTMVAQMAVARRIIHKSWRGICFLYDYEKI